MINVLIIDYRDEYSNKNLYSLLNLQKRRATSAALLFVYILILLAIRKNFRHMRKFLRHLGCETQSLSRPSHRNNQVPCLLDTNMI